MAYPTNSLGRHSPPPPEQVSPVKKVARSLIPPSTPPTPSSVPSFLSPASPASASSLLSPASPYSVNTPQQAPTSRRPLLLNPSSSLLFRSLLSTPAANVPSSLLRLPEAPRRPLFSSFDAFASSNTTPLPWNPNTFEAPTPTPEQSPALPPAAPKRVLPDQSFFKDDSSELLPDYGASREITSSYKREPYLACTFYRRTVEINRRVQQAIEHKKPFHLQVTPLKLVIIDDIEELGRGQNSVAYRCTVRGKGEMVLKLLNFDNDDPKKVLLKFARQLYHYTLYMRNAELKPFIANHENLDYYVSSMEKYLASNPDTDPDRSLGMNGLLEWLMNNVHYPAHLVEFVPNKFPTEDSFFLSYPLWKQLHKLFQFSNTVLMDLSIGNVGVKKGQVKLFDLFELEEPSAAAIFKKNLLTFLPTRYGELGPWFNPPASVDDETY